MDVVKEARRVHRDNKKKKDQSPVESKKEPPTVDTIVEPTIEPTVEIDNQWDDFITVTVTVKIPKKRGNNMG